MPASLADVLEPLREADEYARLQGLRQRGVYNLLTGLPGFFFAFMFGNAGGLLRWIGFPVAGLIVLLAWVLFFWACAAPKSFLPWVRRRRPDWESPLVDSSLVNRAMEKQFWLQAPVIFGIWILLPFAALALFGLRLASLEVSFESAMGVGQFCLFAGGAIALALQARRQGDHWVEWLYWTTALLAPLLFVVPLELRLNAAGLLGLAITWQPLVAELLRLPAPRRWLVR